MAGNKNSGRHTRYSEVQIAKMAQKVINWAEGKIDRNEFTDADMLKILLVLAPKYIAEQHEHSGEIEFGLKELVENVRNSRRGLTSGVGEVSDN